MTHGITTAVADAVDLALEICERNEQVMLERRQDAVRKSADCCIECGLLISSERQLAVGGTEFCTECAEDFERRGGC
jgi:RNA polymerase-binding transcription factor DksA